MNNIEYVDKIHDYQFMLTLKKLLLKSDYNKFNELIDSLKFKSIINNKK